MAITIQAQLAKKVPIPGSDYSSQQASITITAEVGDLSKVVAEAQHLYAIAEQAIDHQLGGFPSSASQPVARTVLSPSPASRSAAATARVGTAPRSSRPYPSGGQRRGPAPVTESQLRFLTKLIADTRADVNAILHQHQIGDLRDLSCKAAAELIDELKGTGVRS